MLLGELPCISSQCCRSSATKSLHENLDEQKVQKKDVPIYATFNSVVLCCRQCMERKPCINARLVLMPCINARLVLLPCINARLVLMQILLQ